MSSLIFRLICLTPASSHWICLHLSMPHWRSHYQKSVFHTGINSSLNLLLVRLWFFQHHEVLQSSSWSCVQSLNFLQFTRKAHCKLKRRATDKNYPSPAVDQSNVTAFTNIASACVNGIIRQKIFSNSAAPIYCNYNAVFGSVVFQLWKSLFWELIANIFSTVLHSTLYADGVVYRASEALLGLRAPQNQLSSSPGVWCLMALVLVLLLLQ